MIDKNTIWKFKNAARKLILLDYDGTLVGYASMPDHAIPEERLLSVLKKIINLPNTEVIIISGRMHQDIDGFLGHLPIEIIAEHGLMYKKNNSWQQQTDIEPSWKNTIRALLQKSVNECPGSFIEEKLYSLAWHYRNSEEEQAIQQSRNLIKQLKKHLNLKLKILDGNKVIEILTSDTSKGLAINNLINLSYYDSILCIGDDETDEDMFRRLVKNDNALTIKVGPGETLAKERLDNVEDVLTLLEELAI